MRVRDIPHTGSVTNMDSVGADWAEVVLAEGNMYVCFYETFVNGLMRYFGVN